MTATEVTCAVRSNGSRNETGRTTNHSMARTGQPASDRGAWREGGLNPDDSRLTDRGHLPQFVDDDFRDRRVVGLVDDGDGNGAVAVTP